ncbi:MAG: DUF72 domain-containing protein [Nitrososphaerales archaeon]
MQRAKVGTSGYSYFWNLGVPTPFEWYVKQGFNTVEINASFYRFPSPSWIKAWSKAPSGFDFSVKVHRSLTHYAKLSEKAVKLWYIFKDLFKPIGDRIAFWLFQMPPSFTPTEKNLKRIKAFFNTLHLGSSAAVEFRDPAWWSVKNDLKDCEVTFCSVDAPFLPREIVCLSDALYLRLHGREEWYAYTYSRRELEEIAKRVKEAQTERIYIYLNNDFGMLENGKLLLKLLEE